MRRTTRIFVQEKVKYYTLLALTLSAVASISAAGAQPFAYVTDPANGAILVIDTATNASGAPFAAGGANPSGVTVSPDAKRIFVTNPAVESVVSGIDLATKSITNIAAGPIPSGLALSVDGKRAYTTNIGINTVSVIDTATSTVTATVTVMAFPRDIAMSPDGARAYVTGGSAVSVIDTASNLSVATISLAGAGDAKSVAVSLDSKRAYVTTSVVNGFGATTANVNAVAVIDTTTNAVLTNIPLTGQANAIADDIVLSPNGASLYVADRVNGQIWIIDTATNAVSASTIQLGTAANRIALSADGKRAYVTEPNASAVAVIDTATNAVSQINFASTVRPFDIAIASVVAPPTSLFANFAASLSVDRRLTTFTLNGRFTLGAGNNGILPLTETVKLSVGPYSATIPAGAFRMSGRSAVFYGILNGARLIMTITPYAASTYIVYADARYVSLRGLTNPTPVTLRIGDDAGTISVRPRF